MKTNKDKLLNFVKAAGNLSVLWHKEERKHQAIYLERKLEENKPKKQYGKDEIDWLTYHHLSAKIARRKKVFWEQFENSVIQGIKRLSPNPSDEEMSEVLSDLFSSDSPEEEKVLNRMVIVKTHDVYHLYHNELLVWKLIDEFLKDITND